MDHVNSLAYELASAMKVECSLLDQCKDQFSELSLLEMNLASCKKLTKVCYHGKSLADMSSNFPFLEDLFLVLPDECKSVNVSSHSKCELDKNDVNAPNLQLIGCRDDLHFYSPMETILVPSKACIEWDSIDDHFIKDHWFQKLRQFLDKKIRFKELKLHIHVVIYRRPDLNAKWYLRQRGSWCLFPFAPDAIPSPSARVPNPKHNHAAQRTLQPEGIPKPKNIRPRPETPNQSRTIILDVYRQKKQPPMRQQQTITTNVYRQRNQTTRICDPKSIRPRYETVTERHKHSTSFERRRLPTLLYLLEALLDVLYGALNLIFLSAIRGLVKLGVVGFSMGVVMALYCATCRALGQYGNGIRFPINLSAVMAINGWLLCSRFNDRKEQSAYITRGYKACIIVAYSFLSRARILIQSFASPLVVLTADHCQWSCKESCLDLLLHVKPCGDRVGPFVIEGLLKDLVQFDSLKLPLTLPCQIRKRCGGCAKARRRRDTVDVSWIAITDLRLFLYSVKYPRLFALENNKIPIKVNGLAWKISMDRLLLRLNLHRCGFQGYPLLLVLFVVSDPRESRYISCFVRLGKRYCWDLFEIVGALV
ncbi:hypothetical protein Tco_0824047 [Tanacetum coccineum]|uniref:Uncharacterized protein n=1 Tax=Tanacetum coccineum TaxID=301880 RepID=A0ABQ5ANQ9_9ASTR